MFYQLVLILIGTYIAKKIFQKITKNKKAEILLIKAKEVRKQRDQTIEETVKKYTNLITYTAEIQEKILLSTATQLVQKIKSGEYSSLQILLIYFHRASSIGLQTENIADVCIDEAIETAKNCDATIQKLLQENKQAEIKKLGLLFGLPMTMKDTFILKSTYNTGGCAINCKQKAEKDGIIAELLKDQGAIPFAKSNLCQALVIFESMNRIWGRAKNPWDQKRTSGGSSGGEAGLISIKGSPAGIGSDSGGSVKIPCLYCGIYGFQITAERITQQGQMSMIENQNDNGLLNIKITPGPMGKCTDDLALILQSLLQEKMWNSDPYVPKIPFNMQEFQNNRKLRIGYVLNNQFFKVSPAHERAVKEAAGALKDLGHETVNLEFFNFEKMIFNFVSIISAPYFDLSEALGDEKPMEEYKLIEIMGQTPTFLRKVLEVLIKYFAKEPRMSEVFKVTNSKTTGELIKVTSEQLKLKEEFFRWWNDNQLDALIVPGNSTPAVFHSQSDNILLGIGYSFIWNYLNYPVGVLPITKIKNGEDKYIDEKYNDTAVKFCKKFLENSVGLPVGVHVACLPFKEELCLNVMKQIESVINFHEYPNI